MQYVAPQPLPSGWPIAPALYDAKIGSAMLPGWYGEAGVRGPHGIRLDQLLGAPQPFGWEGRFYQFRTVAVWPRPLQQPLPPTYVLTRSPESAEFAASHHLGLGVSFAPVRTTAEVMHQYRSMCADHGWEPTEDDLLFRATVMVGETDEQAQEGVRRYWSSRILGDSTPAARAVSTLGSRLRGSSMASPQSQNGGDTPSGPAAAGRPLNFVGSPDTVFRQIKAYHDECGVGTVDF